MQWPFWEIIYLILIKPKNNIPFGGEEGCSIANTLIFEKLGVKIHSCAFLLDFLALFSIYCAYAFIFQNKPYDDHSWHYCWKFTTSSSMHPKRSNFKRKKTSYSPFCCSRSRGERGGINVANIIQGGGGRLTT